MLLGRVVGRLWAARQASSLGGRKLLLVRPETASGGETARLLVAIDGLDAGPGDRVIVAHGTRVRELTVGAEVADKDIIIGIVDGHAWTEPSFARRSPSRGGAGTLPGSPDSDEVTPR
ncbi:MAG TPA: EutN/CcmL family microcompartment protein [Polyangia bacterium]|jgi:ethanolamine utilization protein EutN